MRTTNLRSDTRIQGRHTYQNGILYLASSASYIEFGTTTDYLKVTMISDGFSDDPALKAWAAVFLDEEEVPSLRFALEKGTHTYEIFKADTPRKLSCRIMKYSEQAFASMGIISIEAENEIEPFGEERDLLIEYVGDSITCGYGIEGVVDKDVFTTAQENPWEAYACRAARLLKADFSLLSWSGNGMISHYIAPEIDERRTEKPLIPEMYPYSDRELEERLGCSTLSVWRPEREPDVIVVNIGTNDSSYTRNQNDRNAHFRRGYTDFLKMVRQMHSSALLVCMIGIMDQCVEEEISCAVKELQTEGDQHIFYLRAPLQDAADGLGTDYHPSRITQKKASVLLADFIRERFV